MESIRITLQAQADLQYKQFVKVSLPGVENIIGVRVPYLRKLAKQIYQRYGIAFLNFPTQFLEEVFLQGMVIGLTGQVEYIEAFIPKITNWAICDLFCSSLKKTTNTYPRLVWALVCKVIQTPQEYFVRFGLVMILNYFVTEEYLATIFQLLTVITLEKYYTQMAAAWLITECLIKYPEPTFCFLKDKTLESVVLKKTVQKIKESLRISPLKKRQWTEEIQKFL